jgi:hypothetical protein
VGQRFVAAAALPGGPLALKNSSIARTRLNFGPGARLQAGKHAPPKNEVTLGGLTSLSAHSDNLYSSETTRIIAG